MNGIYPWFLKEQKTNSIMLNFHALVLILWSLFYPDNTFKTHCFLWRMNSVFLFCCFYSPFVFILKTVEKPPCKNGTYFRWFPLEVFAPLDWKVKVSTSSDLAADGWGSATWTLRAGQPGHLSSCELSPELSEFQLTTPRVSLQPPQQLQGCLYLLGL